MSHPFKVIKGGKTEEVKYPTEFVKFDTRQARMEQMAARFFALRDKAILKERAKHNQK